MSESKSKALRNLNAINFSRDLRLDFARGLALLIIFTEHVQGNWGIALTPVNTGFSAMAEAFLFVSGYVAVLAYRRTMQEFGFFRCQQKAMFRAVQLYVAHVVGAMLLCAMFASAEWVSDGVVYSAGFSRFGEFRERPISGLVEIFSLRYLPGNFEILPLFSLLLLLLPLMQWLGQRSGVPVLLISLAIYIGAQLFRDDFRLPEIWRGVWLFNPWAWQFPFFLGVALALDERLRKCLVPRHWSILVVALIILEAAFLARLYSPALSSFHTGKANCEPMRLVHFWAVIVVGRAILSTCDPSFFSRTARPVTLCGQNALITYCASGIFSAVGSIVLVLTEYAWPWQLIVNLSGWTGCVLVADAWSVLVKRHRHIEPAPHAA